MPDIPGPVPAATPGAGDGLPVAGRGRGAVPAGLAGRAGDGQGPGGVVRGRDIGRDIGASLRRYVAIVSGWDIGRDIAAVELDQGGAGELAALGDDVPGDPGGGPHAGEPVRGRGSGERVAAPFFGGHPGELGVVDKFFSLADADHAPAL